MKKLVSVLCMVALLFSFSVPVSAASSGSGLVTLSCYADGNDITRGIQKYLFVNSLDSYVATYSGGSLNNYVSQYLVYDGVSHFRLSGFSSDTTYTGSVSISMLLPLMRDCSVDIASQGVFPLPFSMTVSNTNYYYMGPDMRVQILSASVSLSDGSSLPVRISSTGDLSTYLQYVYFPLASSSVYFDVSYRVVLVSAIRYTSSFQNSHAFPFSVLFDYGFESAQFSGTWYNGRNDKEDVTADLINQNANQIAAAQASQAAAEHEDTVNGFDDSAGQAVNKNLQQGVSSYESEESQAHQDFTDKMDSYENPDISDYVSGVSFISSAVVMWWNALGMFKVILLVGFSLMIFNFISRFRGG